MNKITSAELDIILELIRNLKSKYFKLYKKTNNKSYEEKYELAKKIEKDFYLGNEKSIDIFWDFFENLNKKDGENDD